MTKQKSIPTSEPKFPFIQVRYGEGTRTELLVAVDKAAETALLMAFSEDYPKLRHLADRRGTAEAWSELRKWVSVV